jgi:hypothetical protein
MRAGRCAPDLAVRDAGGKVTVLYGVTDDGLDERWRELIAEFSANRSTADEPPAQATAEMDGDASAEIESIQPS